MKSHSLVTAIEYGLELLKEGIMWRVGTGAKIRTWRDPWIPRNYSRRPTTPQGRCRLRWVADLLDHGGNWNVQLIRQHFRPGDVDAILKIKPLCRNDQDFLAWHLENYCQVLIIWALHCEKNMGASSTRPEGGRTDWELVWKSPAPAKVKVFAWQLARDALATEQNLRRCGIDTPATCQICGSEYETSYHVLMRCPHALALWETM